MQGTAKRLEGPANAGWYVVKLDDIVPGKVTVGDPVLAQAKQELVFVLSSINDCIIVFFRGQILVSICSGTLLGLGLLACGIDYAVLYPTNALTICSIDDPDVRRGLCRGEHVLAAEFDRREHRRPRSRRSRMRDVFGNAISNVLPGDIGEANGDALLEKT